jgi:hypothetical protein
LRLSEREVVDAALGVAVDNDFEGGLQIGEGLDAVHFGGGDQRADAAIWAIAHAFSK